MNPLQTSKTPVPDAELVERARDHDEAAIRTIIQKNNRRLYRVARSIVRNDADAEDVVQEAYVRAFMALESFRGAASLSTWLTRIVVNEALQFLRRRKPVELVSEPPTPPRYETQIIPFPTTMPVPDPEMTMAQHEICRLVEQAIDKLPAEFRTVLIARTIEGMSIEETSDAFGLKPETVKSRLHRARQHLRAELESHLEAQFSHVFPFDGARCNRMADTVLARLRDPDGNLSA